MKVAGSVVLHYIIVFVETPGFNPCLAHFVPGTGQTSMILFQENAR